MEITINREDLQRLIYLKEPQTDSFEEYLIHSKYGYILTGKWMWNDLSNETDECLQYLYNRLIHGE